MASGLTSRPAEQLGHVAEIVGDEIARTIGKGIPIAIGQEPGHVAQARQLATDIGTLPEGQHLVEAHIVEASGTGLDGIEERVRGRVGYTDDDVTAVRDVIEDSLGFGQAAGQCGLRAR